MTWQQDQAIFVRHQSGLLPVADYRKWMRSMMRRKQINWHDALLGLMNEGGMTTDAAARFLLKVFT